MKTFITAVTVLLLICCLPIQADQLEQDLSQNLSQAHNWQKIIIVIPEVLVDETVSASEKRLLTQTSNDTFRRAMTGFTAELNRYFTLIPEFKFYHEDDFYHRYDSEGAVFLQQIAPSNHNDMVIFGHIELDSSSRQLTVQIDGYDGKNSTDWLVLSAPFKQSALSYLEEIYIQLVFDLLNEQQANGLKPIKARGQLNE